MADHNHHNHNHHHHHDKAEEAESLNLNENLDAGSKSFSEALRVSFWILKSIMLILVLIFLASGFRTVGSGEKGLILRFGKIRGAGQERLLDQGLHWLWPYPIEELVKIPVTKKFNLPVYRFWYNENLGDRPSLDPVRDGYCLTRSGKRTEAGLTMEGSDYNIFHAKWQVTYSISDPERFFRGVYVREVLPGEDYTKIIEESLRPLVFDSFADAVVVSMVNFTIEEAISSSSRIPDAVETILQKKLDAIKSGIKVDSVQLLNPTWPRQVDNAFWGYVRASQTKQRDISEARSYADETLNNAAGEVAEELYAVISDSDISEEAKELLWEQSAGEVKETISEALAYRTRVVESARANWEYLKNILPEYRKRPELVIQEIYKEAIEEVLENADEKMILQPTDKAGSTEIRILLNRDPKITGESGAEVPEEK